MKDEFQVLREKINELTQERDKLLRENQEFQETKRGLLLNNIHYRLDEDLIRQAPRMLDDIAALAAQPWVAKVWRESWKADLHFLRTLSRILKERTKR